MLDSSITKPAVSITITSRIQLKFEGFCIEYLIEIADLCQTGIVYCKLRDIVLLKGPCHEISTSDFFSNKQLYLGP
jgi:hypothetical protein